MLPSDCLISVENVMKTSLFERVLSLLLLALCVVGLAGCAQTRAVSDLEAENAQQRERIWKSNMKMEDFRRENESLRKQIAVLESQRGGAPPRPTAPRTILESSPGYSSNNSGSSAPATTSNALPPSAEPPQATLGEPSSNDPTWLNGQNISQNSGSQRTIRVRKADSSAVYTVELLPRKATAIHQEGLHAEFQLKDASGNLVLAAAPVVVMVTDPAQPAEKSRVSKWKYTAEEIAEIINSGEAVLTVPLNMAWEHGCPENLNLELHILYQTSDKRLLRHTVPINLMNGAFPNEPQASVVTAPTTPAVGQDLNLEVSQPNAAIGTDSSRVLERPVWTPEP